MLESQTKQTLTESNDSKGGEACSESGMHESRVGGEGAEKESTDVQAFEPKAGFLARVIQRACGPVHPVLESFEALSVHSENELPRPLLETRAPMMSEMPLKLERPMGLSGVDHPQGGGEKTARDIPSSPENAPGIERVETKPASVPTETSNPPMSLAIAAPHNIMAKGIATPAFAPGWAMVKNLHPRSRASFQAPENNTAGGSDTDVGRTSDVMATSQQVGATFETASDTTSSTCSPRALIIEKRRFDVSEQGAYAPPVDATFLQPHCTTNRGRHGALTAQNWNKEPSQKANTAATESKKATSLSSEPKAGKYLPTLMSPASENSGELPASPTVSSSIVSGEPTQRRRTLVERISASSPHPKAKEATRSLVPQQTDRLSLPPAVASPPAPKSREPQSPKIVPAAPKLQIGQINVMVEAAAPESSPSSGARGARREAVVSARYLRRL